MSAPRATRTWLLWLIVILTLTLGLYAPSFGNGYTYDDADYVQVPSRRGMSNKLVGEWQGFGEVFDSFYGEHAIGGGRGYRPITVLSFAIVHQWFGQAGPLGAKNQAAATAHHVVNVLLFLSAVWVLFGILARFVGRSWPALLGTVVFALHVVRSDPVISTVGRAETMGFLFGGLGTLLYLAALRRSGGARWGFAAAAGFSLFLSFCSKESSTAWILFAPLLALALGWQQKDWRPLVTPGRQALPWLVATILPAAVFGALMFAAVSERWDSITIDANYNALVEQATTWRILNGVMILAFGLYKVVFPFFPACDYGGRSIQLLEGVGDYRLWVSVLVLGGFLVAGLRYARRLPLLFLAMAVFFGFSFLSSNIPFVVETIFGERLLFTPATALSFIVALLATLKLGRNARMVLTVLLIAWLAGAAVRIPIQCADWFSNKTLFEANSNYQPGAIGMHIAAGREHQTLGNRMEWKRYIDRALKADPESALALHEMAVWHVAYGQTLHAKGQRREASAQFVACGDYIRRTKASPQYVHKRDGPTLHTMSASMFEIAGEWDRAESEYREAIAARPTRPASYTALAKFLRGRNKREHAFAVLEEGYKNQPNSTSLHEQAMRIAQARRDWPRFERLLVEGEKRFGQRPNLSMLRGRLLHARGRWNEAIPFLEQGLKRLPLEARFGDDWMCLAECLARVQRKQEARGILQMLEQSPQMPPGIRQQARTNLQNTGR